MGTQDEEIKLNFLLSGSNDALPSSYLKLRSYLNTHSSILANLHGLQLPKCLLKKNLTCRQCFLPWACNTFSIKLLPNKKHSKDLLKAKGSFRNVQKLKLPKAHLVLKCNVCVSRSHFFLPKFRARFAAVVKEAKVKIERKEKKKKDKTCGLKKTLVNCKILETPKSSLNKIRSSTSEGNNPTTKTGNLIISWRSVKQTNSKVDNSNTIAQPSAKIIPQRSNKNVCQKTPHGAKLGSKSSKRKNQNLQKLKKIVQEQKEPVKKTLKDFLTLI